MRPNRSVDSDTLRQGTVGYPAPRGALPQRAGHLHVSLRIP